VTDLWEHDQITMAELVRTDSGFPLDHEVSADAAALLKQVEAINSDEALSRLWASAPVGLFQLERYGLLKILPGPRSSLMVTERGLTFLRRWDAR
jgi:hypothetical protein